MTAKIIIFKPNGDHQRIITDPTSWTIDEKGMLTVNMGTLGTRSPDNVIRTTLPYYIETPS